MRYFVESYGCTMNYGEGAELAERMDALGHERAASAAEADVVVLNTCTVVDTTERRMIRRMNELKAAGKGVVVAGCMAKAQPSRIAVRLPDSLVIPPESYPDFSRLVSSCYGRGAPLGAGRGALTGIIPVAQGCRGACSYCITKLARGDLVSRPPGAVKERFDRMVGDGAREILIAAQDTGCYGRDIGTDLGELVRSLLERGGEYRVRIGMMNPNSLIPVLDSVLDVFEDERVYRFLHIPVQSGSDAVLERMGRQYTAGDFLSLVARVRGRYPDMSIATDLIAGFPGETDEDHARSVALIRALRADTVNITRFSARPGTAAFGMEQINGRISKARSTELTAAKNETEKSVNDGMVGRECRALVTESSADGSVIARTGNYRPIVIKGAVQLGTFIDARIADARPTYLLGEILRARSAWAPQAPAAR